MKKPRFAGALHAAHQQLEHDRTVDLELGSLGQLLDGDGRAESGVDSLVGILDSALRLPDSLTIHDCEEFVSSRIAAWEIDVESRAMKIQLRS